jgi:peptidoglycan hydrolase-like protein with peptidoglycan-binding domain
VGDTGSDVRLLQTVLKNLDFFTASPVITDYFGNFTQHAVLLFQNAHLLNKSGFLDDPTETLLDKVVAANPQLAGGLWSASSSSSGIAPSINPTSVPTTPATSLTRNLTVGSSGTDVALLQRWLYEDGDYPADIITGYLGPLTEAAVKVFQSKYGIVSYGEPATTGFGSVGPRTRAELDTLGLP